jgi:acyl carrier protein
MEIREKIINCVAFGLNTEAENVRSLSGDEPLRVLGMDSLNCIEIVVGIEQEFTICFGDDELLLENINTINKLCVIVEKCLNGV